MQIIKPPYPLPIDHKKPILFLAGSIEMGKAEDWQQHLSQELTTFPITILNPRRDAWDNSSKPSIDNPLFKEQVDWELDGLEMAHYRVFHFEAGTKSPITLLELGLMANKGNNLIHCPEGFWRKGNVDIICERYGIPQFKSLAHLTEALKLELNKK